MNNCRKQCPLLMASLITLTRSKYAIVDNNDYHKISQHRWHYVGMKSGGKAARNGSRKIGKRNYIYMHRDIMGVQSGHCMVVDHINHNTLDNRKCNLRVCTHGENNQHSHSRKNSSSKYKGVFLFKQNGKWAAQIQTGKSKYHLGYYENEIDAAVAYNNAAKKHHGAFAMLNNFGIGN